MKTCSKCGLEKALSEFAKDKSTRDGYHQQCLQCKREGRKKWRESHSVEHREQFRAWSQANYDRHLARNRRWQESNRDKMHASILKTRYNISLDEYQRMYEEQGGRCKICGISGNLVVDHKHDEIRKVPGLLCIHCNSGIGFFRENIEIMRSAIKYLSSDVEREPVPTDPEHKNSLL